MKFILLVKNYELPFFIRSARVSFDVMIFRNPKLGYLKILARSLLNNHRQSPIIDEDSL